MIEIKTIEELENCSKNNDVLVVKFGAEWCGPCKSMHPILESLSSKMDNIVFAEIDVEESPELAENFSIMNIPVTIIFKDGDVVDMLVGLQTESVLEERIKSYI